MTLHSFSSSLISFDDIVVVFRVQVFPFLYYYLLLSIIICHYIEIQLIFVCPFYFISYNFAKFIHSNFWGVRVCAHACACVHVCKSFGFSTCKIVYAKRVRILLEYLD